MVRTAEEEALVRAIEPVSGWLQAEVAVVAQKIQRAEQVEDRERDLASLQADHTWNQDRSTEAARIGRGLARNPERVVLQLKTTVQGCDWLIGRWTLLRDAATVADPTRDASTPVWTEDQRRMAFDLQGIPPVLRPPTLPIADPVALASAQIAALEQLRDTRQPADQFDRESARRGLDDAASPGLRRTIRYQTSLHRRLRWCFDQIRAGAASTVAPVSSPEGSPPVPVPEPVPVASAPDPTPRPEPSAPRPPALEPVRKTSLSLDEEFALADLDPRYDTLRNFYRDAASTRSLPMAMVPLRTTR